MNNTIITVDQISKRYRLGQIGMSSLRESSERFFQRFRRSPSTNDNQQLNNGQRTTCPPDSPDFWALRDVSFEVKRGEVLGVIGRNGAGKSTLLKILSRITEPTSGRAIIRGRVASLLEVGTGFHPELTGRENIYLNGAILGMRKAEITRKFDEIVAFAELDKFVDTPVKRYSSGMYVRLAFAVAAHLEPEILLIDEVLAVGDAGFQKKCLGKMGEVAKEGRTVLFVSHNMVAVQALCHNALCLDGGRVHQYGESRPVVGDYLQAGVSAVTERIWDDKTTVPGNEKIKLRFARVCQDQPQLKNLIDLDTPLRLEFEIWNNLGNALIGFTVHIYTIEGIYVFATASDASPRHHGPVRAVVKIPAHFLNDQIYTVTLQVVKDPGETLFIYQNILDFEVHDVNREQSWLGKWPGVIRPTMEWHTENITPNS